MTNAKGSQCFDLIITGGLVVDGSGGRSRYADIGVIGDKIAQVAEAGRLDGLSVNVIDAAGSVVAPGFIDSHAHDDNAVINNPAMIAKLSQGVTTVISGNCGISIAPLSQQKILSPLDILGDAEDFCYPDVSAYRDQVARSSPGVNLALLVGHSTLRLECVAGLQRKANQAELREMQLLLKKALEQGAIGLSSGTYYKIAAAADEREIIALASMLPEHRGVYATHMRNEFDLVLESLQDSFSTARAAGVRLIISHHKCAGPENWGRSKETLAAIEVAAAQQEVAFDVYPYNAGSTVLDPDHVDERYQILLCWSEPHPEMCGRDLAAIANEWQLTQREAASRLSPAAAIFFCMSMDDVDRIVCHPNSMIGSDGLFRGSHPHPRLWGTFAKVLGHYWRQRKLLSLEKAVHKMTGLTAANFNLTNRGLIVAGYYADLVIFNPEEIGERASYSEPELAASGIQQVLVNGGLSWDNGVATGGRYGRFISN